MISLHALGLYKWLLNTSQNDPLFITSMENFIQYGSILKYLFSATGKIPMTYEVVSIHWTL